jgi:hypothetical protein
MIPTENHKTSDSGSDLPGYPVYPSSEDIYRKETKAADINPDDNSEITEVIPGTKWNEEDYNSTLSGDDLDVPGSEEDAKEGTAGNEDEENDYYSLGGDDHDDLDESHGE